MHMYQWVISLLAGLLMADSHKVPRRCFAAGWCLPLWACNVGLPLEAANQSRQPKTCSMRHRRCLGHHRA